MSVLSRVELRSRRTPKVEMYNPPTAPHFKLSTSILASAVELRSMRMPLFGSVRFWSPGPIFVRADPMFKAQKPKFRPPYTKGSWFWSISFPALDLIHARTCSSARQLNYGFKARPSYNCAGPTDARVFGMLGCTIVRVGPIIHSCVLNLRSAQLSEVDIPQTEPNVSILPPAVPRTDPRSRRVRERPAGGCGGSCARGEPSFRFPS
jgi:hypothetical protein